MRLGPSSLGLRWAEIPSTAHACPFADPSHTRAAVTGWPNPQLQRAQDNIAWTMAQTLYET